MSLHADRRDGAQVLTFRTKAWSSFAPPTCRMPLGQYQGIPRADPGGRCYGAGGEEIASIGADMNRWSTPCGKQSPNDLSRSLTALERDSTLIAVIEMSQSSWLVAGIVPGVERQPLKKLEIDESALLKLLIAGERRRRRQDTRSNASRSPSRPAVMASGWRAGSERATSRPTSFMHRV